MFTVEQMLAEREIRAVLMRYCRGIDRGDLDIVRSVYHPDAIDRHGPFTGSGFGFAELTTSRNAHIAHSGNHFLINMWIDFASDDDARVESYFLAVHPHDRGEEGYDGYALMGGRYLDHFRRRAAEWKIWRRSVVVDWSRTDLPGDVWRRGSWQYGGYLHGVRGPDDPSYVFFGGADLTQDRDQSQVQLDN